MTDILSQYISRKDSVSEESYLSQFLSPINSNTAKFNFEQYELDEKRDERIKAAAQKNEIPIELAESLAILDPNSELSVSLKAEIQPIVERLLGAIPKTDHAKNYFDKFTPENHDVQILFSASEDANACVLNFTSPPIIILNKGLFAGPQAVPSVDALAFIIGHELTHKALELKYGSGRNSKGEESISDAIGLELCHHAGYDAREAREYFINNRIEPKTADERFSEVIDVHPAYDSRMSMIGGALTIMEKNVEKLAFVPTPITTTALPALASSISYIPLREPSGFASYFESIKSTKESPNALQDVSGILSALDVADFNDYRTKKDILSALSGLQLDKEDRQIVAIVDQIADKAIALYEGKFSNQRHQAPIKLESGSHIYAQLSDSLRGRSRNVSLPMGRLRELDREIEGFIAATTKQEILERAKSLLVAFSKEPLIETALIQNMELSKFALIPKRDRTVAWQNHYMTAQNLGADRREPVIKALLSLGVEDNRLYGLMSLPTYLSALGRDCKHLPELSARRSDGERILVSNIELSRSGSIDRVGVIGDLIEEELKNHRYARLPDLTEKLFASLTPGQENKDEVQTLLRASKTLKELFNQNGSGPDYLIGLPNIDKDPVLFCFLNHQSIAQEPALQSAVAQKLRAFMEQDHPQTREIMRAVLSIERDNHTNPFNFEIYIRSSDELPKDDTKTWEQEEAALINYPLAQLLLSLPDAIATSSEKVALLLQPNLSNQKGGLEICSQSRLKAIREILADDFTYFVKTSNSFDGLLEKHVRMSADPKNTLDPKKQFSILEAEFRELAVSKKIIPTPMELLNLVRTEPDWMIAYDPALSDALREKYMEQLPELPTNGEDAVDAWKILHESALIPPSKVYLVLSDILDATIKLDDDFVAEGIYKSILQGHKIVDPVIRERCVDLWAEAVRANIGIDDGSIEFRESLKTTLTGLERVDMALKDELLNNLGKKLNTQRAATLVLEEHRPSISRASLEESQIKGIGIEEVLSLSRREPDARDSILQFLTKPLSNYTIEEFTRLFPETDSSSRNTFGAAVLATAFDAEIWEKYSSAFKTEAARQFYRNFWAAPFEARTIFARELFLPENHTSKAQEEKIYKIALEQAFPSSSTHGAQAQEYVRAYIRNVPDYSRHLSIAALMVAAERSNNSSVGVGYALASFLETMGPAETKAGQAAESHPSVPKEIRDDLKRLKTKADEPTRWGLWRSIEENVPAEIRESIASVDEILGSASFYVVVGVTMKDDTKKVVALLRNHALTRAENGFGLMSAMALDLGQEHRAFNTLDELIDQAKELAKVESNPVLSKVQLEIAQGIYNGATVQVDGRTFNLYVPEVYDVGPKFRVMERVNGDHFNELPDGQDKKVIAKAIAAFEISNILSGLPFDDDRHGGNVKIEGDKISHYDFGGMMLEAPSDAELAKFAEVILGAMTNLESESHFIDNYFREIKRLKEEDGSVPPMVKRVQKALLSLGDYRIKMTDDDLADVLMSAVSSAHPVLKGAALAKLTDSSFRDKIPTSYIAKLFMPAIIIKRENRS